MTKFTDWKRDSSENMFYKCK